MRNVITISLSADQSKHLAREVKKGGFPSRSEYFRHLMWEQQFLKDAREARTEIAEGRGKILTSLRDLR